MAPALAEQLADLARRVDRLSPSHRQPEQFFEDRDEISAELARIAREQRAWPLA